MVFKRKTWVVVGQPRKRCVSLLFAILPIIFSGAIVPTAKAGIQLSLVPESPQIPLGDTTDLFVGINGLGDPPSLSTYDLTVNYDPTLFSFVGITYGDPTIGDQLNLSGFGTITSDTPGADSINFSEVSLDDPETLDTLQASTFVLVTLEFQALNTDGLGTFSFGSGPVLGDALGNPLTPSSLATAYIKAGETPEPYMFLPSLMALVALYFGNRSRFSRI
jgi:hypothetical protein